MPTSQNGWSLIGSGQLDSNPIPETNVIPIPGVLEGDVATLLHWVGTQFNRRVAALYSPGCWGWNAPTPIPGSNVYSNHCSGTAIDFNAPSFPWKMDKMSDSQKQACRDICSETDGVVVWGGDFTTYIDQMHFEINGSAEDVSRIVKKLQGDIMDESAVRLVFKAINHREATPEDVRAWSGLPASKLAEETLKSDGWLTQNHFVTYFTQNDKTIRDQEKIIAQLKSQIGKDVSEADLLQAYDILKKVLGK